MAIPIDALNEYPQLYPDLVVTKVYEDTIVNRFNIETTEGATPGTYEFRILDPIAHLSRCCEPYIGDSGLIQKDLRVICLKDGQTYCEEDLAQIIRNADFRFTAGAESAGSLEGDISEAQLSAFLEAIDRLIFQGDTESDDTNLNLYDGLIKQAEEGGTVIEQTTGSIYDAFIAGFLALPEEALKFGQIAIFVPERYGLLYRLALTRLRLLVDNPMNDINVPGINNDVVVIPTRGLTGTNQILVTPIRNVRFLTNRRADLNTFEWKYIVDKTGDYYIWRIKTLFGIALLLPEWSVLVNVDPSVVTNPIAIDVNIVNNPLNVANAAAAENAGASVQMLGATTTATTKVAKKTTTKAAKKTEEVPEVEIDLSDLNSKEE